MRKFFRKLFVKVIQQEGTPESVGRAIAIGLFIGFILPVGLQTVPALVLAFLFKANKALTWTFTCISNPATVFVLYPIQCYTGSLLIFHPLNYAELSNQFEAIVKADTFRESFTAFASLGGEIITTFFVGGLFYGLLLGALGYMIGKNLVEFYRKRREASRRRREELLAAQGKLPPQQAQGDQQ